MCVGEFPQFIACITLVCVCVLMDVTRFVACITLVCVC